MKKFNKPEIELIVLDNTDICTTSTDSPMLYSYNQIGEVNLTGEVKVASFSGNTFTDPTPLNLDDTFDADMFIGD